MNVNYRRSRVSDLPDNDRDSEDVNDVDVVIVGAGLTGLTVAYDILRRKTGLTVLLVDSSANAGGRIPAGECSEIFHAHPLQRDITQLLARLRISTYTRQPIGLRKRVWFTEAGPLTSLPPYYAVQVHYFLRVVQDSSLHPSFRTYEQHEESKDLAKTNINDLIERLVLFSRARSLCSTFISNSCGARDLEGISVLWLLITLHGAGGLIKRLRATMGDEDRYFIEGGMRRVVEKLQSDIILEHGVIKCDEPVLKIQFNDDRAYVFTAQCCFKCSCVVIAVPPPENTRIIIEPSLPSRCYQSRRMYRHSAKSIFLVNYERPFWPERYTGDVLTTPFAPTRVNLVYDVTKRTDDNEDRPRLAGFLEGDNEDSAALSRTYRSLSLFEMLRHCFQDEEAFRYVDYRLENCSFGNCVGSPVRVTKPGSPWYHIDCTEEPYHRVLFAASEYAATWPGTMDGAIEAGKTTACHVLMRLRPQSLAYADIIAATDHRTKRMNARFTRHGSFLATLIHHLCLGINVFVFLAYARHAYNSG